MDMYDTLVAIDKGEAKATYKKVAEVKAKKKEEASKKYFLIDVLLYRDPDKEQVLDYKEAVQNGYKMEKKIR